MPHGIASDRDATLAENKVLMIRVAHACLTLGLVAVLLLSFWLEPDSRGIGTHEQLLLGPCTFYASTGLPCPSCGMTTAFAHMARGKVRDAFLAQPLGAIGFVVCVMLVPVGAWATVRGKNVIGAAMKLPWGKLAWLLVTMAAAAWAFKITVMLRGWR